MAVLSDAARALADAIAILGDGSELRQAAALGGLDEREAIAAADELAAVGILALGRPLRFEHPLVRSALHDAQPLQSRDRAHLDAARLLAAEGEPPERLASHLLSAPELADSWVSGQLESAGLRALSRGAPAEAADLLERAIAEPPPAQRRAGLLIALGRVEAHIRRPQARAHLEEAISLTADPRMAAQAAWTLALSLGADGDFAGSERVLLDAAARAEHEDREQHLGLVALLAMASAIGYSNGSNAREAVARALDHSGATTHGERLLLAVAAFERLIGDGLPEEAIALAERAIAGGKLFAADELDAPPIGQALLVLIVCDRIERARTAIDAGLARADQIGSLVARHNFSYLRCSAGWLTGDLAESEADGRLAVALARDAAGLAPMSAVYLARTLVDRGLAEEADELLATHGRGQLAANLYWSVLAHLRDAQGRHTEAADAALKLAEVPIAQRGMSCAIPWRPQAAIALAAAGDRDRARELLAEQRPITERWGLPRALAALQRAEGLIDQNTEHLEAALDTLNGTPARLELARTLIDLGAMRRRRKQRVDARGALRAGLDLAYRCAADPLVIRATEELAACGARPRTILLTGVDSLTPSERRVARLAANGKTNPEIAQYLYVSRRTIESQLRSIYRKLDINSRQQLPQRLEPANPTQATLGGVASLNALAG